MLPILQFVFSSFWVWAGTAVLLGIVAEGVRAMAQSVISVIATVLRK